MGADLYSVKEFLIGWVSDWRIAGLKSSRLRGSWDDEDSRRGKVRRRGERGERRGEFGSGGDEREELWKRRRE